MSVILLGVKQTHFTFPLPDDTTCPCCRNRVNYVFLHTRRWLTYWFIPFLPYASSSALVCPVCENCITLSKAEARAARRGELKLSTEDIPLPVPPPTFPPDDDLLQAAYHTGEAVR